METYDWALWRDQRLHKVKSSTVIRELTVVKAIYRKAINEWKIIKSSPLATLEMPKPIPPRERRISSYEEQALLTAFNYRELRIPQCPHDYVACAWLFALETGMRSGEILRLTWSDVNIKERYVRIMTSKNGKKRDVPLSKKAIQILEVLPHHSVTCFHISDEIRDRIFRLYRKKAGIYDLTFHDSRHEAISRLARKVSMLELARIVGVSNPQTLMIYYNPTMAELAEKLD